MLNELKAIRPVRIFISSPSDLVQERQSILSILENLNESAEYRAKFKFVPYEYQEGTFIQSAPEAQVEMGEYLLRPQASDIFICLVWLRMGRPTQLQINPETARPLQSFLEYEFMTAYQSHQQNEKPPLMLFRCIRNAADIKGLDVAQYGQVQRFVDRFELGGAS